MYLSQNEHDMIYEQEDMLMINIAHMCATYDPEELELNYKVAKDRIDKIYKVTRDHLIVDSEVIS